MFSTSSGNGPLGSSEHCIVELICIPTHVVLKGCGFSAFLVYQLSEGYPACLIVIPSWFPVEAACLCVLVHLQSDRLVVASSKLGTYFPGAGLVDVAGCKSEVQWLPQSLACTTCYYVDLDFHSMSHMC